MLKFPKMTIDPLCSVFSGEKLPIGFRAHIINWSSYRECRMIMFLHACDPYKLTEKDGDGTRVYECSASDGDGMSAVMQYTPMREIKIEELCVVS